MRLSIFTAGCGLLAGVLALPAANSNKYVVHERREQPPTNWDRDTKLHGNSVLPLRIALTQNNLHKADEFLMDVSDPRSPNYGKHWTAQEVAEAFAPSDITIHSVIRWLRVAGISSERVEQSRGLNWLHVNLTVHEAEKLLKTKYYKYMHAKTSQTHIACEEYSIPEDVQDHVDFITPTVHFDKRVATEKNRRAMDDHEIQNRKTSKSSIGHTVQPGRGHSIGSPSDPSLPKPGDNLFPDLIFDNLETCSTTITPACLRALYQFPDIGLLDANPSSKCFCVPFASPYHGLFSPANQDQTPLPLSSTPHRHMSHPIWTCSSEITRHLLLDRGQTSYP
jgi:tripeptidyl-peptidase-1